MLAAYTVQRGNQERTREARKEWFDKATLYYAMADRVSRYDQNHLIGRAHFCLLEGRKEQEAEFQLDFVLKNQPSVSFSLDFINDLSIFRMKSTNGLKSRLVWVKPVLCTCAKTTGNRWSTSKNVFKPVPVVRLSSVWVLATVWSNWAKLRRPSKLLIILKH